MPRRVWFAAGRPGELLIGRQRFRHAQYPRLSGLIEIQTTGVLAGVNPQRHDFESAQLLVAGIAKTELVTTLRSAEVKMDRLVGGRQQVIAAGATFAGRKTKCAQRHDQKTGHRGQADRQNSPARVPPGAAGGQAGQR